MKLQTNSAGGVEQPDADPMFAELDRRIAEDDAFPQDVVAWEVIKAESMMRWQRK